MGGLHEPFLRFLFPFGSVRWFAVGNISRDDFGVSSGGRELSSQCLRRGRPAKAKRRAFTQIPPNNLSPTPARRTGGTRVIYGSEGRGVQGGDGGALHFPK